MKSSSSELVKPFLAIILTTVAVPVITHAAMTSDLVTQVSSDSSTSSSEDYDYKQFDPRDTGHDLFDAQEFVQMRHDRQIPVADVPQQTAPVQTSSSAAPCDQTQASSSAMPASQVLDYYGELTSSQRQDLRLQLRMGACPYDVNIQYRMLCEAMLKAQGITHELQVGPRSPLQTQDQFLRSGGDINQ